MEKILQSIYDFFLEAFEIAKSFILDVLFMLLDVLLTVIESLFSVLPVPDVLANFNPWGWTDSTAAYILSSMNIGFALSILVAGYSIRFALNLIPSVFTRV